MRQTTFEARALLFDLDGTLVHSLAAVDRAWTRFAIRHGLDPLEVLPKIHGRRAVDSIRLLLPDLDAEAENLILRRFESTDTEGVLPVAGALEFIAAISVPWAVVTSGTSDVATARMRAAGIPAPPHAVYGEDVERGKPAPDPYLLAAERLGLAPAECIVFEDTSAGVEAGLLAGTQVIGISPQPEDLPRAHAVVPDFSQIEVVTQGGRVRLQLPS